jgi:hypothetical protein
VGNKEVRATDDSLTEMKIISNADDGMTEASLCTCVLVLLFSLMAIPEKGSASLYPRVGT